jgi:hypothetical protein
MQIRKLGTPMAIAALLSYVALGSAKADDSVTTTTTTTTIEEPSTVTTTSIPGSVVYLRTASPTLLITTLEGRRKHLDKLIDEAHDRGEISGKRCEAMKRELRRIAQETGSNTITYPGAVMLAQDLDLIGAQYRTVVTSAPAYVPIISGSHFTIYNGEILQLDDLSVRRADLEARVTKDLLEGRLSEDRAAHLRAQLSNIGAEAALYRADGNLNFKEAKHLYTDFDRVAAEIDKSAGKDNN